MSKPEDAPSPAPEAAQPGARRTLILLLVIGLFDYIDRYVMAAVVPLIRTEFFSGNQEHSGFVQTMIDWIGRFLGHDAENSAIALLSLAFMISYAVFSTIFGRFKSKRWLLLAAGVAIWSLASGASGLALTFGMLLLTRCFVGIGEAAYGPLAPAVISDLYPVSRRGSVMSWFYIAIPVGSALGFVLGGLIASTLGLGWRWAFYILVPPGLVLAIICLFMKDPRVGLADGVDEKHSHKSGFKDYLICLKTPSYLIDSLGMAAMTFAIGGAAFWAPSYIHEYRGVPDLGFVNMMFGGLTVLAGLSGTLIGGWAGDRLRKRYSGSYFLVSGAAMLVSIPAWLGMLYIPFPYAWICLFVSLFCMFFNTGPSNTILANVTHPSIRASAFALNILIIHALGDLVSPFVIGAIADVYNMNTAFLLMSGVMALGSLLWLWGARFLARDTANALKQLDK
jgi:MFS transporter, Spinster family, sphingosine-1-phosphate transporter